MAWLPEIGGIAAGAILAPLIELGKALGWWDESHAGYIIVLVTVVWAGLIAGMGQWPASQDWIVVAVRLVAMLLSVPVGAKAGYESAVKPVSRKRFNRKK